MRRVKTLSLVLVLVLVFSLFGSAFAAEAGVQKTAYEGQIVILHTNDVHGAIDGYSKVAALKAAYEAEGAYVLLLDAGDFIQGTTYVSLSMGATAVELMELAGYDAVTLGNHEFDYGYENLVSILDGADFEVISANVKYGGTLVFDANTIFTAPDGTKIGVFGLTTAETGTKAHPDKIKGVTFDAAKAMFDIAEAQVAALEAAGCDLIVCLAHLGVDDESAGNRSTDLLDAVDGIDLLIDGHSHSVIDGNDNDYATADTMLVSTGTAFEYIGVVAYDGAALSAELLPVTEELADDAGVLARTEAIMAAVDAEMDRIVASSEVVLDGNRDPGVRTKETNLGDFVADAILWSAQNNYATEVDAAITNGGGIRASIGVGDISLNTMKTVFPFGNEVTVITLTGAQLLEALEAATYCTPSAVGAFPQVAGIEFTLDTTVEYVNGEQYAGSTYYAPANPGSRVTIHTVGGEEFSLTDSYTLATNDFTAAGGDTYGVFVKVASTIYKTGVALEDALISYTTEVLDGVIGEEYAEPAGRITILTNAVSMFSDVEAGRWYTDAINFCYANGLVVGMGDGTFGTNLSMNRAAYLTIIYRLGCQSEMYEDGYATTGQNWLEAATYLAELYGFEWSQADLLSIISRGELASITAAYLAALAEAEDAVFATVDIEGGFTDVEGSEYAEDILFLQSIGAVNGYLETDGSYTFRPDNNILRSEVAQVVYKMLERIEFA